MTNRGATDSAVDWQMFDNPGRRSGGRCMCMPRALRINATGSRAPARCMMLKTSQATPCIPMIMISSSYCEQLLPLCWMTRGQAVRWHKQSKTCRSTAPGIATNPPLHCISPSVLLPLNAATRHRGRPHSRAQEDKRASSCAAQVTSLQT